MKVPILLEKKSEMPKNKWKEMQMMKVKKMMTMMASILLLMMRNNKSLRSLQLTHVLKLLKPRKSYPFWMILIRKLSKCKINKPSNNRVKNRINSNNNKKSLNQPKKSIRLLNNSHQQAL